MPITVEEKELGANLTKGERSSGTLVYLVTGTEDLAAARVAVENAAPADLDGLARRTVSLSIVSRRSAGGAIEATVSYGTTEADDLVPTGSTRLTIDTTGGTIHASHGAAVASYPAGAADYQGSIGVVDGRVEGVDIAASRYVFTVTKAVSVSSFDAAYRAAALAVQNTTNNAPFDGWATGEVLYLGFTGEKNAAGYMELAHRFRVSRNAVNIVVAEGITVAAKNGHDVFWVEDAEDVDSTAGTLVRRPVAAHVVRVYEPGDFTVLGLGL